MTDHRRSICDVRLSTVVPASITGEDKTYHFTDADLAMKLHYITTVHFYGADAAEGLGIHDFKRPMFQWLQHYYPICGRIRRQDADGRPFIKCNDSGVRIVEAKCAKSVAEWLESVDGGDHHRLLVYHQPILAHDFGFTPLVFLQLTKFKCGGLCVGMRWAHVLGDAFSASQCINLWGAMMSNQATLPPPLTHSLTPVDDPSPQPPPSPASSCRSLKLMEQPLGDNWLTPNNAKMQVHTFHLTAQHLTGLLEKKTTAKYGGHDNHQVILKPFELISAVVWKSLARIRGTDDAKTIVVVSKRDGVWFDHYHRASISVENCGELLGNTHQAIGVVETKGTSVVADGDLVELARMISEKLEDETRVIESCTGDGSGDIDCIVYGSKLTFVNLEEVDVHRLEIKGREPVYASLSIAGVGDGGAVMVGPDALGEGKKGGGRTVCVVLPENEVQHLKNELRDVWGSV